MTAWGRQKVAEPAPPTPAERLAAVAAASRSGLSAPEAWSEWDASGVYLDDAGAPQVERVSGRLRASLATAGRLAAATGVPLADVLQELARVETAREEAALACETAAAGPRASARVLAWLPVAGLAVATVVEPASVRLMVTTPLGWALLAIGAALTWAGRSWMGSLTSAATRSGDAEDGSEQLSLITACAFLSACMRAGVDLAGALAATASAAQPHASVSAGLARVAGALRLGAPWHAAWDACDRELRPLGRALQPAWERGASPVAALEALSTATLARARAASIADAAVLGVRLTMPVTLCLLPAFVATGIVPLLVAVSAGVVGDVAPIVGSIAPVPPMPTSEG